MFINNLMHAADDTLEEYVITADVFSISELIMYAYFWHLVYAKVL